MPTLKSGPRLPRSRAIRQNNQYTTGWENSIFPEISSFEDQVYSKLQMELSTRKGERLMNPERGNDIPSLVFEELTEDTALLGAESIDDIVRKIPEIGVREIQHFIDYKSSSISYRLTVFLKEDPDKVFAVNFKPSI